MKPLNYIDKVLSDRVIDFLKRDHAGRENAIPYQEVMAIFGEASDNKGDHRFRRLYENRVCSCSKGIFYPRNYAEVHAWGEYIERTYHSAALRKSKVDALLAGRPELRPQAIANQPGLYDRAEVET